MSHERGEGHEVMSKWDKFRDEGATEISNSISASFKSTLFFPSDSNRFAELLLDDSKKDWSIGEICDLSRFCEDFVLCEYISISRNDIELIGPYFLEHYSNIENFPLKVDNTYFTGYLDFFKHTSMEEQAIIYMQNTCKTHFNPVLESVENLIKNAVNNNWILEHIKGPKGYYNSCEEHAIFMYFADRFIQKRGISLSPGHGHRNFFRMDLIKKSIMREIYDPYAERLLKEIDELAKYDQGIEIKTPPFLRIIIERCDTRKDLVKHLCQLRDEFANVRKSLSEIGIILNNNSTIGEKIKKKQQINIARDKLLESLDQSNKRTWIQPAWDIVKGASTIKILVNAADYLLKLDTQRQLVGSLRHFTKLNALIEDLNYKNSKIPLLFGSINKTNKTNKTN
jgi:hypothetical protein